METILDQTTEADLLDFVSDLKVVAAGCQAHLGQIVSNGHVDLLGTAEKELHAAFANAMASMPDIEALLLCLMALKRAAPADRSVQ